MIRRKEKRAIKNQQKMTIKKRASAQNDIHYELMTKSGICYLGDNLYSRAIAFSDITYHTSREDEKMSIFQKYMELLNSLVSANGVQLFLQNKFIDKNEFDETILMDLCNDEYDVYRKEYNYILNKQIEKGRNKVYCDKQFIITVNEDDIEHAVKSLDALSREYMNKLEQLGCQCKVLTGVERLESIFTLMHPTEKLNFSYTSIENSKLSSKNFIAPNDFSWNENPEYFRINDRYAKVLRLQDYSTELSDKFLTDIMNIDTNISTSFHIQAIERGEDLEILNKYIVKLEMEINNKQRDAQNTGQEVVFLPQDLKRSYEEGVNLLEDVQERNQRLFICQFLIFLNAETLEKLNALEKQVLRKAKEKMTLIKPCRFFKSGSLNSILPLGKTELPYARSLNTASTGAIIPFNSKELYDQSGCYYGINPTTGRLIMANRTKLKTASGFILASPGSGKSFSAKAEATWNTLKFGDRICNIFIDPENEYVKPIERLGGTIVKVDPKSGVKLNPFDGDVNDEDYISDKVDITLTICSEILGTDILSPTLKSNIEKIVRRMLKEYINECENSKKTGMIPKIPTLTSFTERLREIQDEDVKDMATALEMYTGEGTYNLFGHESSVDINNKLCCYSIRDIGKTLKALGMVIILECIWKKVIENFEKGIRTYIYCDEFHVLLKNTYTLDFFFDFYKRARKFGAVVTGITQNVEELLRNVDVRTMLSNSEWLVLLNQAPSDRYEIGQLFNLSETELDHVTNSKKGSGLIKYGKEIIPFENEFPKDSMLYDLWDTDFANREIKRNV
jgi:hypothetical protein